ncbi:hypothetical protein C882_3487 [Caenispirillum salinarum AK4]|uniref:Uncharacterized protein n=1 Tax=Caenispirillum salinarum AK4 TaxID=1238182 RepID=K9H2E4_9PROT|nr:hypothetical protein C882_3487 [Caenispirillum salinarum AK4]
MSRDPPSWQPAVRARQSPHRPPWRPMPLPRRPGPLRFSEPGRSGPFCLCGEYFRPLYAERLIFPGTVLD